MQALAASADAAHAVPFYQEPGFWVAVAFALLLVLGAKRVFNFVVTALDDRAETIKNRLEEARRLREEAQELLASYQRRQRDALKEAEEIVAHAREEADRLTEAAAKDLEHALKRREQLALDRIRQAETQALDEVRGLAADVALEATRRLIAENVTGPKAEAIVDAAIKDLSDKLH
jgi:F-type H+-transporting ATPase subunit b